MKRKTFSALLFLLLLTSPLYAQGIKQKIKTFRNSKRFLVKYDKFKDRTWVQCWFATGSKRGGSLSGAVSFQGEQQPKGNAAYFFILGSYSRDWRYHDDDARQLYAIIDGERLRLGIGDRDGDVMSSGVFSSLSGVTVHEQITFTLDAEMFARLATSKSVELKIGPIEFKLKDEHQEAFRDLISLTK